MSSWSQRRWPHWRWSPAAWRGSARAPEPAAAPAPASAARIPAGATLLETSHYRVHSTATPDQTRQVADAVENLHAAYMQLFADDIRPSPRPLTLVLYADREEFRRNNRSRPWAEAYYLRPACYAYYGDGRPNPYH